jgi:hypothetical protein
VAAPHDGNSPSGGGGTAVHMYICVRKDRNELPFDALSEAVLKSLPPIHFGRKGGDSMRIKKHSSSVAGMALPS